MRRNAIVGVLLLVGGCAWIRPTPAPPTAPIVPTVTVPEEVKVAPGRLARIAVSTNGKSVRVVNIYEGTDLFREYDPSQFVYRFSTDKQGSYRLGFYTALADEPSECGYCNVVVGFPMPPGPAPVPPGPTPPGPGPTPPGPTPPPSPSPIARDGLHVLIVEERADRSKLTAGQLAAIMGKTVRDYLNSKCAPDPDMATWKAFRIWDPDTDTTAISKVWQDAMKRPRTSVPWLIISNHPKGGYEGPLPESVEKTMELLKKWGD